MKPSQKTAVCVAAGVMLIVAAQAITTDGQGNPYQSVVERNVFALKPKPKPEDNPPPKPPTPPIELQGITSMFGRQQVLFSATVPGTKPGEAAKKTSMVLKVGERQDDFEVLEINEQAGTVKFNNHGTEEIKSLEKDSAKLTPTAAPPPTVFPGISAPGVPPPAARGIVPASAGSTLKNIPIRTLRGPSATTPSAGVSPGGLPMVNGQPAPQAQALDPAAQAALMILQNQQNPEGPPIPPIHDIPGLPGQKN